MKRVGNASKIDSKDGCTLMVKMEMVSSQLTSPLVIFKGGFGKRLMKEWSKHPTSTVLFTKNHWQTSSTVIIFLVSLQKLYPTKRVIGIIWDKASSHFSEEVKDYIEQSNKEVTPKIVVDFVDSGLTSVYQPPDVVINKPLKKEIRSQYEHLMSIRYKKQKYEPGKTVAVSREEVVQIVENAYHSINMKNNTGEKFIRNYFDKCGLNPWSKDINAFKKHLKSLSENSIYKSLLEKIFDCDITGKIDINIT